MTKKKRAKKAPEPHRGKLAEGPSPESLKQNEGLASQRAALKVLRLRNAGSPPLTQAMLATKAGVALNTVRAIEKDTGSNGAGVNNLEKVANALGVHVSELVK